jgi:hypothetical protein
MDNYKLYTWTAELFKGPVFEVSFIAPTVEAARQGIFAQFHEIKQAIRMDLGEIPPVYFERRIHTDFFSDEPHLGLFDFTEETELVSGELLGQYITRIEPEVRQLNLARILVNPF